MSVLTKSDFYDQAYFTVKGQKGGYCKDSFELSNHWHLNLAKLWFKQLPGDKVNKQILDVGCARGNVVYWLERKFNMNAYGVDVSKWCIENSHCPAKVKYSDISKSVDFDDEKFDFLVCRDVLEHISKKDINKTISEFHRVLKHGGYVALAPRTNRAGKEDKKKSSPNIDPSHVLIKDPWWWVKRIEACHFTWLPRETIKACSTTMAMSYDWDILVFRK